MKISAIELREIHLPLRAPFRTNHGTIGDRRLLIVELQSEDKITGWGECSALAWPGYLPETIDGSLLALQKWLIPKMLEIEFQHPAEVAAILDNHVRGWEFAKAALQSAAWDLAAKAAAKSLAEFIGGQRKNVDVGLVLGLQDSPQKLLEKARAGIAAGYRRIKIKIKPGHDLEYLQALRQEFGDDFDLAADANSAYWLDHFEHLQKLDAFNLNFLEQPFGWQDHISHAKLQKLITTPVCLDESLRSLDDCRTMFALNSGRVINLKPGRVGGIKATLDIHNFCRKNKLPLWCGGMLESGIGRAVNIALASLPGFSLPGDLTPPDRYLQSDIIATPWHMDAQGQIAVPHDRPGIGVQIDRDSLEKVTLTTWRFR